jgi:cellulose synthase/poly-beta-1,6-N-acetylglucosamine synthase-like glycosyltransferase
LRITIGIPSYNERLSIENLLKALESQNVQGHEVEVIVSDDSSDDTPQIISNFARSSRLNITLIHHNKRRGAARAWNEIFQHADGDVLVLYDADIIPHDDTTMILASSISDNVVLCAANPLPLKENGVTARASIFNSSWLRRVRNACTSQYTVMGRALAVRTEVAKKITMPDIIANDLYLQCKVLECGYDVTYRDDAIVWFKPASTMLDFASQVVRAVKGHREVGELVKKVNITLPLSKFVVEGIRESARNPVGMLALAASYATLPLYAPRVESGAVWQVAGSTKG